MSNYKIKLREDIRDLIVKLLSMGKVTKTIDQAKKMVSDDPTTVEKLDVIKQSYKDLDKNLESFCKRNPESYICQRRKLPAASWGK